MNFKSLILILLISSFVFSSERLTPTVGSHWSHMHDEKNPIVNILDTDLLKEIELDFLNINQTLSTQGLSNRISIENNKKLSDENKLYKIIINQIGDKETPHNQITNQVSAGLLPYYGDIPEMVQIFRGLLDQGGDFRPPYKITKLANDSHFPYKVVSDGDEPRHFDHRWLFSEFARFRLVGIVNRLDKLDQYSNTCGEIRYIYRLVYNIPGGAKSSLPFFFNVVHEYKNSDNCNEIAKNWVLTDEEVQELNSLSIEQANKEFISQKLKKALIGLTFKQIEINFQALRFPSGYMHDFGGQAMYMQRIFGFLDNKFQSLPLENTPDVIKLKNDPDLLSKFSKLISDNLEKIDLGTFNISEIDPELAKKILARRSVSWSTLGRSRSANKPYRSLFLNSSILDNVDQSLDELEYIRTKSALIERLDNFTCMGCHQSGGTAGFHLLGYEDEGFSHHFNRQQLPLSAHAFAEEKRRSAYINTMSDERVPNKFRPHSVFPSSNSWDDSGIPGFQPAKLRDLCIIDSNDFNSSPSCAPFLGEETECKKTVSVSGAARTVIGECVIKSSNPSDHPVGGTCFKANINEEDINHELPTYNFLSFKDNLSSLKLLPGRYCSSPKGGAPLGRKSGKCSVKDEKFEGFLVENTESIPGEICANRGGNGFDTCATTGDSGNCLEKRVVRSKLDTCYPGHFCREDYICQMLPKFHEIKDKDYRNLKRGQRVNLADFTLEDKENISQKLELITDQNEIGFCVPTYFLFNMRLDGHPNPITGKAPGAISYDRSLPLRGIQ